MNRALWLTLFFAACGPEQVEQPVQVTPAVEQEVDTSMTELTGFPCDVREALQANCASCHAGPTYVTHFNSRADLLALGRGTHQLGVEVALRLRPDAAFPMPPAGTQQQPTVAERQLIDGWVQSGMPAGACGPLTDTP